jgi:hypothetical protein
MQHRLTQRMNWSTIVLFAAIGTVVVGGMLRGAGPAAPEKGLTDAAKAKVDPVQANGAIFEGWTKPDVALVFTGAMAGYLEPCGCAGLQNQKGGLKRRDTMLNELRDPHGKGWPVIAMDGGSQERDSNKQAWLKLELAYQALMKMGYQVVGLGANDLKVDLASIALNFSDDKNPLVSANVDTGFSKPFKVVSAGGMKIGVTSVLGAKEVARSENLKDYKFLPPTQAIPQVVPELLKAKCDHLVLLVNGSPDEAKDLAVKYKDFGFDWILTTQGAEVPPKEPATIQGTKAHLIEVGEKAEYAVVVGLYKNGSPSFRYQRVPLDHRFADAKEITDIQVEYQKTLQNLGLDGLGLKPVPHQSGRKYVGSKTCEDCHTHAAEVFNKTPHASATETLVSGTSPPRIYDPECLSCHVTGWEPQKQIPFESGYLSLKDTPNLIGNGCENCHGPAAKHAAVENGQVQVADKERQQLREALQLKIVKNEGNKKDQVYKEGGVVDMCMKCHDLDNSPDFDFQAYWPKVKHVGKD